jgi:hypothetical protein
MDLELIAILTVIALVQMQLVVVVVISKEVLIINQVMGIIIL